MKEYTIKQLADIVGVTTRTLRYYDEVGILEPSRIGENGYRYYDYANLLQLQQIMFYRELDVPLKEIQYFLGRPDDNVLSSLADHRHDLKKKVLRYEKLIETIEQTILTIQGEWTMIDNEYFEGFDEAEYEEETQHRWGKTAKYKESHQKWSSYTDEQKDVIKAEGGQFTLRMVTKDPATSPENADVQTAVGEYFHYLNKYFYKCDLEYLRYLADMWVTDPRFAVNYERIREGGAEFIRQAVHIYCDVHAK